MNNKRNKIPFTKAKIEADQKGWDKMMHLSMGNLSEKSIEVLGDIAKGYRFPEESDKKILANLVKRGFIKDNGEGKGYKMTEGGRESYDKYQQHE